MQYAPENVENHVCAHTKQTQTGLAHAQSALLYDGEKGQAGAPWKLVTASLPRQRLENGVHNSLFFFFFPATSQPMEFLGQGSESSYSCDLYHSCRNARSLIQCATKEISRQFQYVTRNIQELVQICRSNHTCNFSVSTELVAHKDTKGLLPPGTSWERKD